MLRAYPVVVAFIGVVALTACKGTKKLQEPTGEAASGVKQVAVGAGFTVALFNDGHVRMVGTPLQRRPAGVRGIDFGGKVAKVAASRVHVCALLETGAVQCMGRNIWGELGYGHLDPIEVPAEAGDVEVGGKVVDITAGHGYTCALLEGGNVRCWGSGQGGRLGYGNRVDVWSPADVGDVPVGGKVASLDAGVGGFTCATLDTAKVRCWGQAIQGSLGYGSVEDVGATNTPASAGDVQLPEPVDEVTVGSAHACAAMKSGKVRCWGFGSEGRLGYPIDGNVGDDETPLEATDVDLGVAPVDIEAGATHTCALTKSGTVRCWGNGRGGQLGYGERSNVGAAMTPAQAGDVELPALAKQIDTGATHTCALLETGDVMCWGQNLGDGQSSNAPVKVEFGVD